MPRVVIVGGGISGLSTAWYLGKAGIRATIIEQQNRLGGVIRTDYIYGCDPSVMSALSVVPQFIKWEAKYGSLTRATRKELKRGKDPIFTTLKRGLQSLVDELERQLRPDVLTGTVETIEQGYRVRVNG